MYAFSADTSTIRQKATRKAESLPEQRLKTSLKAGCARHAEWESNTLRRRNKEQYVYPVYFCHVPSGLSVNCHVERSRDICK